MEGNYIRASNAFNKAIGIRNYTQEEFEKLANDYAKKHENVFVTVNDFTATFYNSECRYVRRVSL